MFISCPSRTLPIRTGSQRISQSQQLKGPQKPRKEASLDSFTKDLPDAANWRTRQIELQLSTVEEYGKVIQGFTARDQAESSEPHGASRNGLATVARILASLVKTSLTESKRQTNVTKFQVLILVSVCIVLNEFGFPSEFIDELLGQITENVYTSKKRLLDGARWVNDRINEWGRKGCLGIYRATELFLLSTFSNISLGNKLTPLRRSITVFPQALPE